VKRATLGSFLAALLLVLFLPAPGAFAHTELTSSDPADGAVLDAVPSQIVLTFDEELLPETVNISVADGSGTAILVADAKTDGAVVTATWPPGLIGPDYSVNYRVVSADGHPVSGTVAFTAGPAAAASTGPSSAVTTAPVASAAPSAAATPAEDSSKVSAVPYIALGVGVALIVVIGILVVRRRGAHTSP
jgi:copper resistance protein C